MFGGVTKRKKTSISTHKKRRTNNNIPKPTQRQSNKQIIKLSSIKIGQPTQQQQPPTLTNKRSSSRALDVVVQGKIDSFILNDSCPVIILMHLLQ